MWDLVGNPEDRFWHDTALINRGLKRHFKLMLVFVYKKKIADPNFLIHLFFFFTLNTWLCAEF